jgi:hypothetical protein
MAAPDRWLGPRIDRRQFLTLAGAVVVAGCAPSPSEEPVTSTVRPTTTPTPATTEPPTGAFDALRRLRTIVRASFAHFQDGHADRRDGPVDQQKATLVGAYIKTIA